MDLNKLSEGGKPKSRSRPFDRQGSPSHTAALEAQLARLASLEDPANCSSLARTYRECLENHQPPPAGTKRSWV